MEQSLSLCNQLVRRNPGVLFLSILVIGLVALGCGLKKLSHRGATAGSSTVQDQQVLPTAVPSGIPSPDRTDMLKVVSTGFADEIYASCFGVDVTEIAASELSVEDATRFCGRLVEIDFLSGIVENKEAIDSTN